MTAAPRHRSTTTLALFVVYSLIILAPDILFLWERDAIWGSGFRTFAMLLMSVALYAFLCALIGRLYIVAWLLLPLALLAPAEMYYMALYHQPSSARILAIIGDTNMQEAADYLRGRSLLLGGVLGVNLLVCVALCVTFWRRRLAWGARESRWMVLAFCGLLVALLFALRDTTQKGVLNEVSFWKKSADAMPGGISLMLQQTWLDSSYPFGVPIRVAQFLKFRDAQRLSEQNLANFRFHARQVISVPGKQVYVLVIGETGRRDRWQLNGYQRPTNPRLAQEANLVNFSDMISVTSSTFSSVPFMVSQHRLDEDGINEKSVVSAFREAGFTTYWLSNQDPQGSVGSMFSTEADHKAFYNPSDWRHQGPYDEVMLKPLQDILAKPEARQLIVLHTMGSHFDYAARYPDAFDVFKPSAKPAGSRSDSDFNSATELNNSYDNSIVYVDYFLDEVIKRLKATGAPAFMLYSADHGEDILGGDCPRFGHGLMDKYNLEIASVAWYSDSYGARFPGKVASLRSHATQRLTEQSLTPTLIDAASITIDNLDLERSVVSDQLRYHPRYVITSPVALDYDQAKLAGYCQNVEPSGGAGN